VILKTASDSWRKNLGYQWVSTLYIAVLGFVVSVLLARKLGVEGFGTYSYILSLAGIFFIFQDGGYKTLIFRERVDNPSIPLISFGVAHVVSITALGVLIVMLLQPKNWLAILTAFGCMGLVVLSEFVSSLLKGKGDFKVDAIWKITIRSLTASAILWVLFYYEEISVTALFVGWSAALLLALIWPIAKGYLSWPSFNFKSELYRAGMAFLAIDVATVFYFRSDIVLLEYFGHVEGDVGQYSAAYRILEGIILLAAPVAQVAFRSLRLRKDQKKFFSLLSWSLLAMVIAAITISTIGICFGSDLILTIFGEQYQYAGELLPILLFAILFILPNCVLTQGAIALNREVVYAKIAAAAALLNIGLNILLIPDFGAKGAAITTIISEGVLCLCLGWVLWRQWIRGCNANWR